MSSLPISTGVKVEMGQHHRGSAACQQRKNEANASSSRTQNGTSTHTKPSASDPQNENLNLLFHTLGLRGDALHVDIPYSEPTTAVIPPKMDNRESTGSQQPVVSFDFRVAFQLGKVLTHVKENNKKQNELLLKQEDLGQRQESHGIIIWRIFEMQRHLVSELEVIKRELALLRPDVANVGYRHQRAQPPPQNFQ